MQEQDVQFSSFRMRLVAPEIERGQHPSFSMHKMRPRANQNRCRTRGNLPPIFGFSSGAGQSLLAQGTGQPMQAFLRILPEGIQSFSNARQAGSQLRKSGAPFVSFHYSALGLNRAKPPLGGFLPLYSTEQSLVMLDTRAEPGIML